MLKKSLALILVLLVSLTCVSGVVMADASKAPAGPADIEGAAYIINETFAARPTQTIDNGDYAFTWTSAGSVAYEEAYNAIAHSGFVAATMKEKDSEGAYVDKTISDGATYTFSIDILAPNSNLESEKARYDFYIKNSTTSYKMATVETATNQASGDPELKLYLAQQDSGKILTAGAWYRITSTVNLSTGNVTSSAIDIATGTVLATKTQTDKIKEFSGIQISSNVTITNFMYSQNWRFYKEPVIVYPTSPKAPADVKDAIYYLKNNFTARPAGKETVSGVEHTWSSGGALAYNENYDALQHSAYVQTDFASAIVSDNGKYMLTFDFMVNDIEAMVDLYQFQLNGYEVMKIGVIGNVNNGNIYMFGSSDAVCTLADETWYTFKLQASYPDNSLEAVIYNAATGEVVASSTKNNVSQLSGGITKFRIANRSVADTHLFTQSWRLYQLAQIDDPIPADPIENATYYVNKYFTVRPNGTEESNGVSYIWTPGGNTVFDGSYNAVKHSAFLNMEFAPVFTTAGKYVYSADIMLDGLSIGSTAYDFKIKGETAEYTPFSIKDGGTFKICGADSDYTLETYKWYTVKFTIAYPEGKIHAVLSDNITGEIYAEADGETDVLSGCITWIRTVGGGSPFNRMYSQNWSFCRKANVFETTSDNASITAIYTLEDTDDVIIAVALYQGSKMVDVAFVPFDDHKGEVKATIAKQDGCTAKAFLWKGGSLKPVFEDIDVK